MGTRRVFLAEVPVLVQGEDSPMSDWLLPLRHCQEAMPVREIRPGHCLTRPLEKFFRALESFFVFLASWTLREVDT